MEWDTGIGFIAGIYRENPIWSSAQDTPSSSSMVVSGIGMKAAR